MNTSKDRLLASGKEQIEKSLATKEDKASRLHKFQTTIRKLFGEGWAFRIGETATKCLICGALLNRNNDKQICYYCCDEHRKMRHNKKRQA